MEQKTADILGNAVAKSLAERFSAMMGDHGISLGKESLRGRLEELLAFMDPDGTRFSDFVWMNRQNRGLSTEARFVVVPKESDVEFGQIIDIVKNHFPTLYVSETVLRGLEFREDGDDMYIHGYVVSDISQEGTVCMNVFGDKELVISIASALDKLSVEDESFTVTILDSFAPDGTPQVTNDVLSRKEIDLPENCFYPFLEDVHGNPTTIEQLVNDWTKAKAATLILVGPPGTGKTTLARGMAAMMDRETNAVVSSEIAATHPGLVPWVRSLGREAFVAIEDADNLVKKREDGNGLMSSLLNFADGLSRNKTKLVISTNLPSTAKMDSALIRPGRNYMVIQFRELTPEEANNVRKEMGMPPIATDKNLTLSKVLNYDNSQHREQETIGFISNN